MKKSIKKTILGIALLSLLIGTASCTFTPMESIEEDMSFLLAINKGLTTFTSTLAADADILVESTEETARTINPSDTPSDDDYDIYNVLRDGATEMTPEETYDEYFNNKTGYAEVPDKESDNNRKYITDFYGDDALEAYFRLKKNDVNGDYYKVELYIYDRSNLLLDYEYEEYLVAKDSWSYLDETYASGLIESSTHYYDGSVVTKEILESGSDNVYDIAVPEITEANHESLYMFDITNSWAVTPTLDDAETDIDEPNRNLAGGDFYLKTQGTGEVYQDGSGFADYEVLTFYSEYNDQDNRNAVSYILQPEAGTDNHIRTVIRSASVYEDNELDSRTIRSLKVSSWRNSNPWQYETQEIDISTFEKNNDNLINYTQTDKTYSGSLDGWLWSHTVMDLEEQNSNGGTKKFKGTYQVFWSNWIENYTVSYKNGTFKLKKKKGTSRSMETEISLALKDIEDGAEFTIPLNGGGSFTGVFRNGVLSGTYTSKSGEEQEILVKSGYILLGSGDDQTVWQY